MIIGFVGAGLMGAPILRHLLAAGHEVLVSAGDRARVDALLSEGARWRDIPAALAAEADVFFSCRVTPEQSRETFLGAQGVVAGARRGLLCVDLSTIDPATARQIGAGLDAIGVGFLDAPISGGPDGAEARTLTVIAGGAEADIARARPVLALFAKAVLHMGPVGAGVTAKLCNNLVSITTHALLAEAVALAGRAGIAADRLYEVLHVSSAQSRTLERMLPGHVLPRDFAAKATITTIMKDLDCAIDTASELGLHLLLPATARLRFEQAVSLGLGEADISSVLLAVEAERATARDPGTDGGQLTG